jgi:hypothetical protein
MSGLPMQESATNQVYSSADPCLPTGHYMTWGCYFMIDILLAIVRPAYACPQSAYQVHSLQAGLPAVGNQVQSLQAGLPAVGISSTLSAGLPAHLLLKCEMHSGRQAGCHSRECGNLRAVRTRFSRSLHSQG